ncbi:MAG: glycosyltransferase family 2 protein [Verrucomicrobiales bacterium]|nr:glycosyltransferase family 2 protein [Verrucomicrobiales bacterium]
MTPLPLSVSVITRNEAANLGRCLDSVAGLAAETVVMDSGSTDGTRDIAVARGARWVHQDWLGYRDQKQAALLLCTQPWVLALDADEEVSPEMRQEIIDFFKSHTEAHDGASFPRKVWFLGRWITHGDWYPDRKLRLVRRSAAKWGGSPEHDKLEVPGAVMVCRGDLHHFSFPSMARYVEKINIFADEYLKRQLAGGKTWSLAETLFRPAWRFVRAYILRRGFMDGFPGLWIAWSTAYQTFVRHSRLYEHSHRGAPPGTEKGPVPAEHRGTGGGAP